MGFSTVNHPFWIPTFMETSDYTYHTGRGPCSRGICEIRWWFQQKSSCSPRWKKCIVRLQAEMVEPTKPNVKQHPMSLRGKKNDMQKRHIAGISLRSSGVQRVTLWVTRCHQPTDPLSAKNTKVRWSKHTHVDIWNHWDWKAFSTLPRVM